MDKLSDLDKTWTVKAPSLPSVNFERHITDMTLSTQNDPLNEKLDFIECHKYFQGLGDYQIEYFLVGDRMRGIKLLGHGSWIEQIDYDRDGRVTNHCFEKDFK